MGEGEGKKQTKKAKGLIVAAVGRWTLEHTQPQPVRAAGPTSQKQCCSLYGYSSWFPSRLAWGSEAEMDREPSQKSKLISPRQASLGAGWVGFRLSFRVHPSASKAGGSHAYLPDFLMPAIILTSSVFLCCAGCSGAGSVCSAKVKVWQDFMESEEVPRTRVSRMCRGGGLQPKKA